MVRRTEIWRDGRKTNILLILLFQGHNCSHKLYDNLSYSLSLTKQAVKILLTVTKGKIKSHNWESCHGNII